MGSHRSHLNLVSLRTARCSSASCSVEAKTSWTAIFRIQGLDQPASGLHTPSEDIGQQHLVPVGKADHFLAQLVEFGAVLGHARCINLFLKVWAVLLPVDRCFCYRISVGPGA